MCFEEIGSKSRTSVCSQATVSTDLKGKNTPLVYFSKTLWFTYHSIDISIHTYISHSIDKFFSGSLVESSN